jgi:hypothetical protein
MTTAYRDPKEAQAALTSAFSPTTPDQAAAVRNAAALVPAAASAPASPVVSPIQRTIAPASSAADRYLDTFTPPQSADQIAEQKRKQSAGLIDSLNKVYDDQVAASQKAGQERLNANNAISVLSGLAGSTEAVRTANTVKDANQKEVQALNDQRAQALSQIYTKISDDAATEAREQLQDATRSAEDIVARRKQSQTDAVNNLKLMASSGLVDFDSFKNSPQNAQVYQYALDSVGGSEDALRSIFAINRPQEQIIGTPQRIGDHFVQAYQNPLTGKVSYDTIQLPFDLPPSYTNFQKIGSAATGESLIAIPDNWDGDMSKVKTVASTHAPSGDGSEQLYSGLSSATATAVRARVSKFASDNTIQNFSQVQDGYNFANSLAINTKNPADDQGLIYALAKVLDPGSVVREGEYATAQKYSQSWINAYGKGISQALLGTGFLSETARENIKKTIAQKYDAQKRSYDQTVKSYTEGISTLTGRGDGAKFLTDYVTPETSSTGDLASQVANMGYDYAAMKADGYTDTQIKSELGL